MVTRWALWTLAEVSLQAISPKRPSMLWRSLRRTLLDTRYLLSQEDTSVETPSTFWQEFWGRDWKMERLAITWMNPFTTVLTATWWMVWVLRTVRINFTQKLTPTLWNQVEFTKHIIQLCLVWLAMEWISSQRTSTLQLRWKSVTGYVFPVWEPIHTDLRATSMAWEVLKKSSDGTPSFKKTHLNNKLKPKESEFSD